MRTVRKCNKCGIIGMIEDGDMTHIVNNCYGTFEPTNLSCEELSIMSQVLNDNNFFQAMIDLKENDIIEYGVKMSQFKAQVGKQESQMQKTSPAVRCPRCGSTNVQIVPRKWSVLSGYMTNKTDRVCVNCKHKF